MKKREPRRPCLVKARMRDGADWTDVVIHNMSSRGLLASCARALRPGAVIEIRRVHHIIIGRVVWARGRSVGVRTQDRIDIDGIIAARAPDRPPAVQEDAERRNTSRALTQRDIAERAERSRTTARLFQFVLLTGAVGGGALLLATEMLRLLGGTLGRVTAALAGTAG
ncbi:PilZ domain-containing protein [Sphingomonas aracearum]|uniref:PilZ domain-containing protein n=1 Tax=Sphingomonas aracearum TaxID=2283317 RepID=UPI0011C04ECC|nr:PilZ domain-containing protein [Sphingomonas aracearum]